MNWILLDKKALNNQGSLFLEFYSKNESAYLTSEQSLKLGDL